jgi:excisionase family DNA binding protein
LSEEWLSPAQVAELFGLPVKSIYEWSTKRTGPPKYRIGRHLRFKRSEVNEWADSRRKS